MSFPGMELMQEVYTVVHMRFVSKSILANAIKKLTKGAVQVIPGPTLMAQVIEKERRTDSLEKVKASFLGQALLPHDGLYQFAHQGKSVSPVTPVSNSSLTSTLGMSADATNSGVKAIVVRIVQKLDFEQPPTWLHCVQQQQLEEATHDVFAAQQAVMNTEGQIRECQVSSSSRKGGANLVSSLLPGIRWWNDYSRPLL
jgi:hypothetical protein